MSENTEETVRIYTGSDIMAEALVGRLKEAAITPILRDDEQSGVMFGSGSKFDDQVRIFVRKDELAVAQPIVDAYLLEIGEEE
ncbi:hypothetical protein Aeqsu_2475 [Aequorivita sublithincola DSM 14238]|uniref:Uncharacterized protein n=1 Tax=Aequorivita sublithincola (strain DSM 14238 / LMG 21431 / ACAM 643 / 9-3) TaxID=746697 RepID=I3YY64_AEQSU|nr:DUF2007 domain-containing protein [Aequorivita sublithincola]AFL81932.1 hypothetical protein Aeqsu_2475 [Aequorivita sublithincola DSM 14238]